MNKPYSESCEQNRAPILAVIKPLLKDKQSVLEIGSGTGQHAVYFSQQMPHIIWQPSDQAQYLEGINLWLQEAQLVNLQVPLELNVIQAQWPDIRVDAVFSANTLHIMHWHEVEAFFAGIRERLNDEGLLIIYGPFNYNNQYTSDSNARFDVWLKSRDPQSAIRHFENINELAEQQGLKLLDDYAMPANNRLLCWVKL
jgi:cyclopropane fatty-acyl-phospholipid synthase-like methyltransferase